MNETPEGYHACSMKYADKSLCTSTGTIEDCDFYCKDRSDPPAFVYVILVTIILFFCLYIGINEYESSIKHKGK